MAKEVIESAPADAPVIAPTAQDREVIDAEQNAAWNDDKTDVGGGEVVPDGAPAADADVITDKPALAGTVPPPKPGAAAETAPEEKPGEVKPGDEPPKEEPPESPEKKAEVYWATVAKTFPKAAEVSQSQKFAMWFDGLTEAEKADARDLDKPEEAVKLMGRFYEDVAAGKVPEPPPPGPAPAFDLSAHLTERGIGERKLKMADGTETTLAEMSKPDQHGDIIAAMGAMTEASEQAIMGRIQDLVNRGVLVTGQAFNALLERIGDKELSGKVPDSAAVTSDPKFKAFRDASPLLKKAWNSGDVDSRAEIVKMYQAESAKAKVADAAAGQRKTAASKAGLHSGSLRGGSTSPDKGGESTVAEDQDKAWDTPIEVEGAKV